MLRTLFILCFLLQAVPSNRQLMEQLSSLKEQIQEQQQAVESLAASGELTERSVAQLSNLIEASNGSISNTLSVTNIIVALVALFIAFGAIILGVYITRLERKVRDMSEEVTRKQKEVKQLTEDINNNIDKLYERIRREDTKAYLRRLTEVPRDISNIAEFLFARQLSEEDYPIIKKAYFSLIAQKAEKKTGADGIPYGDIYMGLFFQHFPGQSLKDSEIRQDIIKFFNVGINAAFPNDIEKEVREIGNVLSDKNVQDREEVLYKLRSAIAKSKEYKDNDKVLSLLKESLGDEALWDTVEKRMK